MFNFHPICFNFAKRVLRKRHFFLTAVQHLVICKKVSKAMKIDVLKFIEKLGFDEILKKRREVAPVESLCIKEDEISENTKFDYFIVSPENSDLSGGKYASAIFLFHGLNERNWDKYLPWAESLANNLKRPVILFPLSMHINRSPVMWSDARAMQRLIDEEYRDKPRAENLTFINYALSKRLQSDPFRFYLSGRETIYNVHQLMNDIRDGKHPLLSYDCRVDIFAYSIGALMSQVLISSDVEGHFDNSKLFMFCGGALFNEMNGSSRMIMDGDTFRSLKNYFTTKFIFPQYEKRIIGDNLENAFIAHIDKDLCKDRRESFYRKNSYRICIISLKNDTVIPTSGIRSALGKDAQHCIEEMDFPFKYSHENPFPEGEKIAAERKYHFEKVFSRAAEFLR